MFTSYSCNNAALSSVPSHALITRDKKSYTILCNDSDGLYSPGKSFTLDKWIDIMDVYIVTLAMEVNV